MDLVPERLGEDESKPTCQYTERLVICGCRSKESLDKEFNGPKGRWKLSFWDFFLGVP